MARYNSLIDLTKYPVPAKVVQRRMTSMFSDTPGETIQPYPYWLDDVVPIQRGLKSVAWQQQYTIAAAQTEGIPATLYYFPIKDSGTMHGMFTNSQFLWYDIQENQWKIAFESPGATRLPTRAYVRNESYLYMVGKGLYHVTETGLVLVTPNWGSGVPAPTDIIGCTVNSGYLILYSADRVYWSAPTNPMVFYPSSTDGVSTGAGSTNIQGLQGDILTIEPIAGGAIVYTNQCAFTMRYTSNPLNPWAFSAVSGCAGIIRQWHVANGETGATQFIWSVVGLQQVTLSGAQSIIPEFTAHFAQDILHTWDGTASRVAETPVKIDVKLTVLANNMLAFSVGPANKPFQYCWLYDLQLGRWGRISIDHWHLDVMIPVSNTTAVQYEDLVADGIRYQDLLARTYASLVGDIEYSSERPLRFAVYGADGYMHYANFADVSTGSNAIVAIGDFRLTFNRMVEINEIVLSLVKGSAVVELISKETGKTTMFADPAELGRFLTRTVGSMITVLIRGDFELSDVLVRMVQAGSAR